MATITEDFCSFEIAQLLKEKGFDAYCPLWYNLDKPIEGPFFYKEIGWYGHNSYDYNGKRIVSAPTLQTVMKWLRKVHKILIEITSRGYLIDNDVEWECDIKAEHRLYFRHIIGEKSYESCANKAIKYCLENLIKK